MGPRYVRPQRYSTARGVRTYPGEDRGTEDHAERQEHLLGGLIDGQRVLTECQHHQMQEDHLRVAKTHSNKHHTSYQGAQALETDYIISMVRKYARLGPLYLESRGCTSLRGRSRRRRRSRGRHGWDGACRATTYQQADANSYHAHCVIKSLPGSPWSPALTCSRQILRNGPYFRVVGGRGHGCSRYLHQ